MIDHPSTADNASEHRFPAAYSQGFAHVRVLTIIDPDSTGPLGVSEPAGIPVPPALAIEGAPRAPLDDLLRAD